MASGEIKANKAELYSAQAVSCLKRALFMDPDMPRWLSGDGKYMYVANPMERALPCMPAWQFTQCMNAWQLCRIARKAADGDSLQMDMYTLIAGVTVLATQHEITMEMLDENLEAETLTAISESAQLQCDLGWQQPEATDYASIDNAIHDLIVELELFRIANLSS